MVRRPRLAEKLALPALPVFVPAIEFALADLADALLAEAEATSSVAEKPTAVDKSVVVGLAQAASSSWVDRALPKIFGRDLHPFLPAVLSPDAELAAPRLIFCCYRRRPGGPCLQRGSAVEKKSQPR